MGFASQGGCPEAGEPFSSRKSLTICGAQVQGNPTWDIQHVCGVGAKITCVPQCTGVTLSLPSTLLRSDRPAGGEAPGTKMTGKGVLEQEVLMVLMSVVIQTTVLISLQLLRQQDGRSRTS